MGAVYPAISGQVLCGQTLCGTWRATWDRPTVVLKSRTFSITITEGPVIHLTVNRPVLFLNARAVSKQSSTSKAFGRPVLTLKGGPYIIQPFLGVVLNRAVLYLRGKAVLLSTSVQLTLGRPLLYLLAGRLERVGAAGLIPTVPGSITLTPSPDQSGTLVPTAPGGLTLVATTDGTLTLVPTTDNPDLLLVPTVEEVR